MSVYLLHAERPYIPAGCEADPRCWMRHYLGSTDDLDKRMRDHRGGRGRHPANVVQVWRAAGIGWQLARTWEGNRKREREIKSWGHFTRLCPECHPMPRIDRWAGGRESPPCVRVKARNIDPRTVLDPWAIPPAAVTA